jgi:hypothetical protein
MTVPLPRLRLVPVAALLVLATAAAPGLANDASDLRAALTG